MSAERDERLEQRGEASPAVGADAPPPAVARARVVKHTQVTVRCGIDHLGELAAQRRAARPRGAPTHEAKVCNPGEGRGPLRVKDDCSSRRS
ncbi:MAG TPA: hypothetical protein VHV81_03895 [Steroidobacteraceae bacterium]|jgi:hypothetical protein|nr:hypothetical protein [Steroidobacteraceae bacterium]